MLLSAVTSAIPHAPSIIPSHRIAQWLLTNIDKMLWHIGLGGNRTAQEWVYLIVIAALALLLGLVIRATVLWVTRRVVSMRKGPVAREILRDRLFSKCFHIIPPLVFMALIPFAFSRYSHMLDVIMRIAFIYTLITLAIGLNAVLTFVFNRYNERMNTRNLPLQGILNIGKGIVWIIITILSVSIIIDKSPMALLAGLGAFAAALMLIFKDSILGFVAGIQMSQNDMLHVGDWIVVPSTPANGIVIDVSLTAVKVQNWDNTIVTVPPYTLVQGSFQNWRGMSDSGVRRICTSFLVDYSTILPCTPQLLDDISRKYPRMAQYINTLRNNDADHSGWMVNGGTRLVNGTIETNLGLFRAYLCDYLIHNPHISNDQRVLVQLLDPKLSGQPLQIWCFTNTTDFNAYESIMSAILEHIAHVIGDFGLAIYNDGAESITIVPPTPAPGSTPAPSPTATPAT